MRSFNRPSTVSARFFTVASASLAVGENLQHALQRIVAFGAPVEDQVFGDLHSSAASRCSGRIFDTCTIAPLMPARIA